VLPATDWTPCRRSPTSPLGRISSPTSHRSRHAPTSPSSCRCRRRSSAAHSRTMAAMAVGEIGSSRSRRRPTLSGKPSRTSTSTPTPYPSLSTMAARCDSRRRASTSTSAPGGLSLALDTETFIYMIVTDEAPKDGAAEQGASEAAGHRLPTAGSLGAATACRARDGARRERPALPPRRDLSAAPSGDTTMTDKRSVRVTFKGGLVGRVFKVNGSDRWYLSYWHAGQEYRETTGTADFYAAKAKLKTKLE